MDSPTVPTPLPLKSRLFYGAVLPAVVQALAGACFAVIMIQTHKHWSEAALVIPFFLLPAAYLAGLLLDGLVSLFKWKGRGLLFVWSLAIGMQPPLIFFLWVMLAPQFRPH
jgi:hypothetical protein